MDQINEDRRSAILGLYSHMSRMYNSTVNAMMAVIFGWFAFIGLALNLKINNQFSSKLVLELIAFTIEFKLVLVLIAVMIVLIASYLYVRILAYGRYIAIVLGHLGLGDYLTNDLPRNLDRVFRRIWNLNWRPIDNPDRWTKGEVISLFIFAIIFGFPFALLFF